MKYKLTIYLLILVACGSNSKSSNVQSKNVPDVDDSIKNKSASISNDTLSGPFIRPCYYSRVQDKNVNSWPGKPDTTGMFSAKITCGGKSNKTFIIYNNAGDVVQSGKLLDKSYECGTEYKSNFIDMNFDGFLDFKVNYEMGATGNSWDEYWLFNPADQKFQYNIQLSELISAIPYPREKRVESYSRSGMDYQTLEDYEWNRGALTMVKREIVNADSKFVHQIYEKKEWEISTYESG
ncbi:MAG: hypothetical protein IPN88_03035 [Bacteroidetes bacterium]|nr:hypothetical protein [Bacteroidota bacterium]